MDKKKSSWVKIAGLNVKFTSDGRKYFAGRIEQKNVDIRIVKNKNKDDSFGYLLYTRKNAANQQKEKEA